MTAAIADDGARWMRDRLHAPHVLPMYVPMQEISRVQPVEQHVEALKSAMRLGIEVAVSSRGNMRHHHIHAARCLREQNRSRNPSFHLLLCKTVDAVAIRQRSAKPQDAQAVKVADLPIKRYATQHLVLRKRPIMVSRHIGNHPVRRIRDACKVPCAQVAA